MTPLYLDFESFSTLDLGTVGGARYVRSPETEILIATYAFGDEPVQLWDLTREPGTRHSRFLEALEDPEYVKIAANAPFDRGLVVHQLKKNSPADQWRCALVAAYGLSFSGGLEDVMKQAGFPEDQRKKKRGKALIRRFGNPAPSNHTAYRYTAETHPEEWQEFLEYARQDTEALRSLSKWLSQYHPMSSYEWRLWQLDQKINEAGMPVDAGLCRQAMQMYREEKARIKETLAGMTGLRNPLSNQQMREYLSARGHPLEDLRKDTVSRAIARAEEDGSMPPDLVKILRLYQSAALKAPTKWNAFLKQEEGGVVRGAFQFAGASRTRRWAGRGVQLHNLKRGPVDDQVAEFIALGNRDLLEFCYGSPMTYLANSIRAAVTAPPGQTLVVNDLSSIESVMLGWLTYCNRINRVFLEGRDTYKDFAVELFHIPYDRVTKEQRTFCKPAVLGCGYYLGWKGLIGYALQMGVKMTPEEASTAVSTFRQTYPELPVFWDWLRDAIEMVLSFGVTMEGYRLRLYQEGEFLFIDLPSERRLAYHKPQLVPTVFTYSRPDGSTGEMEVEAFTYMGKDSHTNQWTRISAHPGGVTENIVQALARDVLAHGMLKADQAGLNIRGHVHDEIICCEDAPAAEEAYHELGRSMTTRPPWTPDMWLGADGYTAKRYRKD